MPLEYLRSSNFDAVGVQFAGGVIKMNDSVNNRGTPRPCSDTRPRRGGEASIVNAEGARINRVIRDEAQLPRKRKRPGGYMQIVFLIKHPQRALAVANYRGIGRVFKTQLSDRTCIHYIYFIPYLQELMATVYQSLKIRSHGLDSYFDQSTKPKVLPRSSGRTKLTVAITRQPDKFAVQVKRRQQLVSASES
ncbi:hypothetical protein EVAR_62789_1 [Eumeta japonica]|uniref:Uncharacterized protein n=1 Tax=Eumeta variegata TaxID=151549 RepID=A0A4C1Z4X5_EUMVA|nr:hypothetical protein EVAR_62789_1 [Eumeta japonica]